MLFVPSEEKKSNLKHASWPSLAIISRSHSRKIDYSETGVSNRSWLAAPHPPPFSFLLHSSSSSFPLLFPLLFFLLFLSLLFSLSPSSSLFSSSSPPLPFSPLLPPPLLFLFSSSSSHLCLLPSLSSFFLFLPIFLLYSIKTVSDNCRKFVKRLQENHLAILK